jgi:hypothetical protein
MKMCDKTDRDIDQNELTLFRMDYEILNSNDLGLPNCVYCGKEPHTISTQEAWCEHRLHILFESCGHVVGVGRDVI